MKAQPIAHLNSRQFLCLLLECVCLCTSPTLYGCGSVPEYEAVGNTKESLAAPEISLATCYLPFTVWFTGCR